MSTLEHSNGKSQSELFLLQEKKVLCICTKNTSAKIIKTCFSNNIQYYMYWRSKLHDITRILCKSNERKELYNIEH